MIADNFLNYLSLVDEGATQYLFFVVEERSSKNQILIVMLVPLEIDNELVPFLRQFGWSKTVRPVYV